MTAPTTDDLVSALFAAQAEKDRADRMVSQAAAKVLEAAMVENGWTEIQVDVEEQSIIETVTLSDGSTESIDSDDYEDAVHAAGACPRSLYGYRDKEYRANLDEVRKFVGTN